MSIPLFIGWPEALIILLVVVVLFGGSRLAGLGKGVGRSIREFKEEVGPGDKKESIEGGEQAPQAQPQAQQAPQAHPQQEQPTSTPADAERPQA